MKLQATLDNVIISVKKKIKNPDELLVDSGEEDPILIGQIVAVGNHTDIIVKDLDPAHQVCVYKNRVAVLPWETDTENFYVVKEENIYGIMG